MRFTITEQSKNGQKGEVLTWDETNRACPVDKIEFKIDVSTVRADYMGTTSTPTEQILHTSYAPFQVAGSFNDHFGGAGWAKDQMERLEAMAHRARLVQLEWDGIKFYGILKNPSFTYRKPWDIGYAFELSPHGRNRPDESKPIRSQVTSPRQTVSTLNDILAREEAARVRIPLGVVTAALITNAIKGVLALADAAQAATSILASQTLSFAAQGEKTVARAVGALRDVSTTAQAALVSLRSVDGAGSCICPGSDVALTVDIWVREARAAAYDAAVIASAAAKDLADRLKSPTRAFYSPRAGESLQAIAILFYGSASLWRRIYEANGLQTTICEGWELLAIPDLGVAP